MSAKATKILLAVLATSLLATAHASAATIYDHVYSKAFTDGTGTVAGPFSTTIRRPAFDGVNGKLYVADQGGGGVLRSFDASGVPSPFPGAGTDSLAIPGISGAADVAVDESAEPSQGNIYVSATTAGVVYGFSGAGEPLNGFPLVLTNPAGVAVDTDGDLWVSVGSNGGKGFAEFNADGTRTGAFVATEGYPLGLTGRACQFDIDSHGYFYFINSSGSPCTALQKVSKASPTGKLLYYVNSVNSNDVTVDRADDSIYITTPNPARVTQFTAGGNEIGTFGAADAPNSFLGLTTPLGAGLNPATGDIWVVNQRNYAGKRQVEKFKRSSPITVPAVTTETIEAVSTTSINLRGVVNAGGVNTTDCHFEWGTTGALGTSTPCLVSGVPTNVFTGSEDNQVYAELAGLRQGQPYYYRVSSKNANNRVSRGAILAGYPQGPPTARAFATELNTDSAVLNAEIDPNGGETTYRFEWGTEAGVYGHVVPVPDGALATSTDTEVVSREVDGLEPESTYHFRVVAVNQADTELGQDEVFDTFAEPPGFDDPCANSLVRQQTGAALLSDCRAYELVSARDTGGYSVESDLVVGQSPLGGFPRADDRALYGIDSGGVPGPWNPTNRGVDPYLATRTADGWQTEYAGIPADLEDAGDSFSSPLNGADSGLRLFSFGGEGICEPCFADGKSNVPLRMPDGSLIKGMAGSLGSTGDPAGTIVKRFSADGSHFLFGSAAQFEPDANSNGTDATIYVRDLDADQTRVVSKLPNGSTIQNGDDVAALDISDNGSRVVFGRLVSTDVRGNDYYQLYMYVGSASPTIALTPGSSSGAIYNGMTSDGGRVYFTTPDALTTAVDQDTDSSDDVYRADVTGGSSTLTRVSAVPGAGAGGAGDTDGCTPVGTTGNQHWNTVDATADCSAAPIAGGGGVASEQGDLYFLSPEVLDPGSPGAEPVADSPNLYLSQPGESPRFVTTLESNLTQNGVQLVDHTESGSFGSFSNATGIALALNGEVWVFDIGDSIRQLERYAVNGTKTLAISDELGPTARVDVPATIATDPTTGDLFVPTWNGQSRRYNDSGNYLGPLTDGTAAGVDPASHNVYFGNEVAQSAAIQLRTPTNTSLGEFKAAAYVRGIAVDSRGRIYVATTTRTELYKPTRALPGTLVRTVTFGPAYGVAVDPENDDVYISQGNRILHLTSSGRYAGEVHVGGVATSRGIAIGQNHRLYVVEGGAGGKVHYYDASPAPDLRTDNPAVVHAVNDAGTRHTEDFQVTPDGGFAVFNSTLAQTGFDSGRHSQVYRYDATESTMECASCAVETGAGPTTDTTLVRDGLNLTDDGKVFFSTDDPLVLLDSNGRPDVYQWDDGVAALVSPGISPYDASLLTVSADGRDVLFFTRDTLVREDLNGTAVKLYDARSEGGFPYIPPAVPCRASDECHGPSSPVPTQLSIPTITGSSGNHSATKKRCGKGKVRRHHRCVRVKKKSRNHRRAAR